MSKKNESGEGAKEQETKIVSARSAHRTWGTAPAAAGMKKRKAEDD